MRTEVQLSRCWVTVTHGARGGGRVHIGAHDPRVSPATVARLAAAHQLTPAEDREVLRGLIRDDSISWETKTRAQQITWRSEDA